MTLSRRTVAKGAAWATPVVLVGASAPVMAASARQCPPMPVGGSLIPAVPVTSGWTWVKNDPTHTLTSVYAKIGMLDSTSTTFNMWADTVDVAVGTNNVKVTATSAPISVTKGCTYTVKLVAQTQAGYYGTQPPGTPSAYGCTTYNTNLQVNMGGTAILPPLSTQAAGGGTVVQFPVEAPNSLGGCAGGYGFGANGVLGATNTFTGTYTASATGTVPITMDFTLWGTGATGAYGNNDDWHATISFESCAC